MSQFPAQSPSSGDMGYDWPVLTRAAVSLDSQTTNDGATILAPDSPAVIPHTPFTEAAEWIGRQIAELSNQGSYVALWSDVANTASRLFELCDDNYRSLLLSSAGVNTIAPGEPVLISGRSPVHVTRPDDRLAMAQPPQEPQERRSWCVPQVLDRKSVV